jgi:putative flippase GtrA
MIETTSPKPQLLMLARYALAGGLTTLVYIVIYNIGAHFEVQRFFASNIAYACALLFQYFAHGIFTFGHREVKQGRLARYLAAVGVGAILAGLISEGNTRVYVLPDLVVSLIVMAVVATTNFFFFTFWVYAVDKTPEDV